MLLKIKQKGKAHNNCPFFGSYKVEKLDSKLIKF